MTLFDAPSSLLDNELFMPKAISDRWQSFRFASSRLLENEDFVMNAIKKNAYNYNYCLDSIKQKKQFNLKAISTNNYIYGYLTEDYQNDMDIINAGFNRDIRGNIKRVNEILEELNKYLEQNNSSIKWSWKVVKDLIELLNEENDNYKEIFEVISNFKDDYKSLDEDGVYYVKEVDSERLYWILYDNSTRYFSRILKSRYYVE